MKNILITGGLGYIGSHTCVELLQDGYNVIIADNLSNSNIEALHRIKAITCKYCYFYQIDVTSKQDLDDIFVKHDIDAVIHFAGYKAVGESVTSPLKYYANNIGSTITLCETMQEYNVKKLVFSSSATVYGLNNTSPLTEDLPLSTTNPYGTTKLAIEKMLTELHVSDNSLEITMLRYFNPIGAHASGLIGEDPKGIPSNIMPFITQVASGKLKQLSVFGNDYNTHDGTGVRDYIHVVDLAIGHIMALKTMQGNSGLRTYNLGTGTGYSVMDIINHFESVNKIKIPYIITGRRQGDVATCYADPSKAQKELGWKATKNIADMCQDAWRWQSKNPNGYCLPQQ
jgi:UDP-glucose 4-epimerase